MTTPKIISPITSINDIEIIAKTVCRKVYAEHSIFLEPQNYNKIFDYIQKAKEYDFKFFINFKSNISEKELINIENFFNFLMEINIDGILVNSFDILQLLKNYKLPFKAILDSGLNIHNLAGIEFANLFHPVQNINITEEVYTKNLIKIKKYTKYEISIDSENLPWIASDLLKDNIIENIIIKGNFENTEDLIKGINQIENIIKNPKRVSKKKLPFTNFENSQYKSNHFSGEILSATGDDFKFKGNIKRFDWQYKRIKATKTSNIDMSKVPRLNLRLTSLEQFKYLKAYLRKSNFNPVYSVEYGEIISTADLAKNNFNKILEKIKKDCIAYGINLQLSTPRILIERDFDRVYEYVKLLCIKEPYPSTIIVNNIGYWWSIINDTDYHHMQIELGQGLNLLNSSEISCLAHQYPVSTIDLSNFENIEEIKLCIDAIKDKVPVRKLTIAGNIRIPSSGLCPLNNDSAILSRLSCAAPCHYGNYAISDPAINANFPITMDGFCRMHLYKDKILDLFKYTDFLSSIGINEFVIDFSSLPANAVTTMLNRFISSIESPDYTPDSDFLTDKYNIQEYLTPLCV